MSTSQGISFLSKPEGRDRINVGELAYMRERHRAHVYNLVIDEFEKSGISKTDLAARLGKGADQICRWLGSPGNWGVDTVSDLLFAISGAEPEYSLGYPLEAAPRNFFEPDWLTDQPSGMEPVLVEQDSLASSLDYQDNLLQRAA